MKGTPRPVQNTQDIPVGENVPVFLSNCPGGSREAHGECCLCLPFEWTPGCLLQCCRKRSFLREHATPHGLCVCGTGVEFGCTAWQKGVGRLGLLRALSCTPVREAGLLVPISLCRSTYVWVECVHEKRLCRAVGKAWRLPGQSHLGVKSPAAGLGTLAFSPESESNSKPIV